MANWQAKNKIDRISGKSFENVNKSPASKERVDSLIYWGRD